MAATTPLIKCESEFLAFADDFVAVNDDTEEGFLEDTLEEFVSKFGWGLNVSARRAIDLLRLIKRRSC